MDELQELVTHNSHGGREATGPAALPPMTPKLELTVDEVIDEYVGSLGFSQLIHVFLVSLAWVFDSQNTLVTIFSDAKPSWACKGGGSWCDPGSTGSVCKVESGHWEWIRGNGSSTIAEWGIICDRKFYAGIPASLFFLGSILGSAAYGCLAGSYLGRKRAVLVSCLLTSITAFLTSFSPNVWIYALLCFSNGFAWSGIGICCFVLSTEVIGRKWRGQVGQYGFFFFTTGFLSLSLIAYPNRTSWRNIYKIISLLPFLYSILILPFVSESPRWLIVRGRNKEALQILNKLARLNGKKLPQNLTISNSSTNMNESVSTKSLWSARWAAKRMLTVMIAGFGVGFLYYGIQLNVENLNLDLYFTVVLNALVEIPAVLIGIVLLSFTDRRLLISSSAYIAGVSCILCIFFSRKNTGNKEQVEGEAKNNWPQLTMEAIGIMAASKVFDVLYIFCVELFPTNVRNFAVSMLRQALMLGASIAPLLVVLGRLSPSLSFLAFGALGIFSGLVIIWLPETRNAPLYETLEQQEEEKLASFSNLGVELESIEVVSVWYSHPLLASM
ncbi:organic cation/carnitine transporter 1-like [Macadamia integrifolia]|uniref:organic cation/carnitine transporter 1-like n=1 Tax=Macadamia integrifolia TaxID=60698 RepID=UPI001C4EA554|nr:organic cation/carnitine transporter 1-like [Macadamia integrifolia]